VFFTQLSQAVAAGPCMKRDCPTIQELLAFDAVARHESITLAAGALCITVSAVSKQIAGLEAFLGRELLQKNGRGVQLTPQGRVYWQKISGGLRAIETATFEARSGDAGAGLLTLASVPTFLTKWLIPRLPAFSQKSRHVMLSFSRHLEPSDGIPAGVDAAIRYGPDGWPGVVSEYIAGREFVLIVARALVEGRHRIAQPPTSSATRCCTTRARPPPGGNGPRSMACPKCRPWPARASRSTRR
jgi:LysR family glycine cleavage system transcriptional activator